ncbi:hypothetical protein B2J93_5708 [Marssonina coronariae]|uniref:Cytochrome P450 monooxygenase n=1 Tax=Diplocarpon coronariae TaxID=2795749 RepID=A0A218Z9E0_9HELO|nr:hypothetical protein B2J93_5708 [Marssonina coronariae]
MSGYFFFTLFDFGASTYLLLLSSITTALYVLYRYLLPKPIPGIPYNKRAIKSLLGDVLPMLKHIGETQELYTWITAQNVKLNSPIIQLFARPFSKPWVIVTDWREAQDILLRRTKEFDRSNFFGDIFTAAPHIYNACLDMLQLWERKSEIAKEHPFNAPGDIYRAALDAVWFMVFGANLSNSTTKASLRNLLSAKTIELPSDIDAEAPIIDAPLPPCMQSVITLSESLETSLKSPLPVLAHWFLRQTPAMRKAIAVKDKFIKEEIDKTIARFAGKQEKDMDVRCAMDDILRRETLLADKDGREPMFHSRSMYDEIFGFVVGAHDTTATTLTWALKLFADNPDVQGKFRSEIQSAQNAAVSENRIPSVEEITKTNIPYMDAVVEEIVRCSLTEATIARTAMADVEVLGHRIPKGTDVFLMGNGPSFFSPAFQIHDKLRSQTCLSAKERVGSWDPEDMAVFNPERWLAEEDGTKVFNAAAGPLLTFGLGPRGCYGRRMAYLEMKIFLTLIVWTFELQRCPAGLSGYAAVDKLTHAPRQCYVRLRRVE